MSSYLRLGVIAGLLLVACSNEPAATTPPPPSCVDNDNDGVDSCSDCDDNNPQVKPGAQEKCDGIDNNCDSKVDEGCTTSHPDAGGQPGPDAGQPGADAGQPGPDAGQPGADAGQPGPDGGGPVPPADTLHSMSSGSSYGSADMQTSSTHTNNGVLGQPVGGAVESSNAQYKHYGGFTSLQRR